ncbi:D-aspartate oxidase [Lutzomyia longipalpis]|uniref:Putative d-aspartate oxidase n=1 Tax=Lutzomyia longipalpis TaxID=7200 RepID=A0A7G3AIB7_LUTLO|nr:D-aspartate oxidase [Lutzomyia longipalpis]
MKKIAVIGAGVNGLSSAVQVAEHFYSDAQVVLVSDDISPNTTGDGSAGLWEPYLVSLDETVLKWSEDTHRFFHDLWKSGLAPEVGVCLQPIIRVVSNAKNYDIPKWSKIPFGCTSLSEDQLRILSQDHKKNYTGGIHFVSFTCEPTKLLPYLLKRFLNAGGRMERKRVESIDELAKEEYDLIINCTGLGSQKLANDPKVHPIRGQVTRVHAPWLYATYVNDSDDGNYIIVNTDTTVLGGTRQVNDYNTKVSEEDDKHIQEGCEAVEPSLKDAKVVKKWVGLRPARDNIRLEKVEFVAQDGTKVPLIHNYGHGGSGVCLAWGCGKAVLQLAQEIFREEIKSKL